MAPKKMNWSDRWTQSEKWLLTSKDGRRFLRWFIARNWRTILGEYGARLTEYVEEWILKGKKRHAVVLELHPDGFVQVWGKDVSVVIVQRYDCMDGTKQAEEDLHRSRLRGDHQTVYGDARYLRASAKVSRETLQEAFERRARWELSEQEVAWRRVENVIRHPAGFLVRDLCGISQDITREELIATFCGTLPTSRTSENRSAGHAAGASAIGRQAGSVRG